MSAADRDDSQPTEHAFSSETHSRKGNSRMTEITLIVDASYCPKTHASGWGAWAKRDRARGHMFGGGFTVPDIRSSSQAELLGIANALHALENMGWLDPLDSVMVQSDCTHALDIIGGLVVGAEIAPPKDGAVINKRKTPLKPNGLAQRAVDTLNQLCNRNNLTIRVRHVRGHKPGGGRPWVNRQCDKVAKQHMIEARKQRRAA